MSEIEMMARKQAIVSQEPHIEGAEGAYASFSTDMRAPLKECKVGFEPVQDLHGYDEPWVGGHGNNILPFIGRTESTNPGVNVGYSQEENAYTLNGTTVRVGNMVLSYIPPEQLPLDTSEYYTISVRVLSGSMTIGEGTGITFAVSIFNSAQNAWIRGSITETEINGYSGYGVGIESTGNFQLMVQCWREGTVFNNLKIRVQIEKGKTASAWTPYENLCPVKGFGAVNVMHTGRNLLDPEAFVQNAMNNGVTPDRISCTNDTITVSTSAYQEITTLFKGIKFKPNTQYTVSARLKTTYITDERTAFSLRFQQDSGFVNAVYKLTEVGHEENITLTSEEGRSVVGFCFANWAWSGTVEATIQVEEGPTAHEYEPFHNTYKAEFPVIGPNLLDPSKTTSTGSNYGLTITYADNVVRIYGTPTTTSSSASFAILQYANYSLSGKGLVVQYFNKTGTGTIKTIYGLRTTSEKNIAIMCDFSAGTAVDFSFRVSVAETTQKSWSPYSRIAYGGTVNLLTGQAVIDHARVDIKYLPFFKYGRLASSGGYYYMYNDSGIPHCSLGANITEAKVREKISFFRIENPYTITYDCAWVFSPTATLTSIRIGFADPNIDTIEKFNAWLEAQDDPHVVYPISDPIVVQLTPQQLLTLRGQNNIWSDANGDINVKYWTH